MLGKKLIAEKKGREEETDGQEERGEERGVAASVFFAVKRKRLEREERREADASKERGREKRMKISRN